MRFNVGRSWVSVTGWVPGVVLILGLLAALPTLGQPERRVQLIAAASDDHLWFVGPDLQAPAGIRLYHHAVAMGGPYFRSPRELPQ